MTGASFALAVAVLLFALAASAEPLRLHPENPHYFLFRGKPTVLITSGEHYGAVLNLDFDFVRYLDTLAACGLNHTRTFVGAYFEHAGAFKIARNTLGPALGRFICPWGRSVEPGYVHGGNKFDLAQWDPAYFQRLKLFLTEADKRGIVVEVNLFCPFYEEQQWALSPFNPTNNVNGLGPLSRNDVYTLDRHAGLLPFEEAYVRKVVAELQGFDNLYYEIMNEPYARGVPENWQHHIADVIAAAEQDLPQRHLISQNIANGRAKVEHPHPAVSILNFHYAWPPDAVALNYALGRALGDNETGFRGTADRHYRQEGWAFILAGGALYNNLDYSFTVGHEDGTFEYPPTQPGGGGPELRRQLAILARFINGFDFLRLAPDQSVLKSKLPEGLAAQALVEPGKQYALYLYRPEAGSPAGPVELQLELPAGKYRIEWVSPLTGEAEGQQEFQHPGGERRLQSPPFDADLALSLRAAR